MKYIRTENNIYEVIDDEGTILTRKKGTMGNVENGIAYFNEWGYDCDQEYSIIKSYKEQIIYPGDTLEKLCDFALSEWSDGWWETYDLKSGEPVRKDLFIRDIARGDCLSLKYGIKTDKGLIYVAKMNEAGELELL